MLSIFNAVHVSCFEVKSFTNGHTSSIIATNGCQTMFQRFKEHTLKTYSSLYHPDLYLAG